MRSQVLVGGALLLTLGCRGRTALPPVPAGLASPAPSAPPPNASIELERTACHGRCPVYTVSIAADGSVRYSGEEHVRVRGTHIKKIDPSDAARLFREVVSAGFLSWRDLYETGATDMASATLTLTYATSRKTVVDYGPDGRDLHEADSAVRDKLEAIELRVDTVARSADWVTCPGEDDGRCPE